MLQYVTAETLTTILSAVPLRPPIRRPAASGVTLDLSFGDVQNNGSPVAPSRRVRLTRRVAYDLT